MNSEEFPKFYNLKGVPVRVEKEGNKVVGYTYKDIPIELGEVLSEAELISIEEYDSLIQNLAF